MSAPSGPVQLIPPGFMGTLQLKNMGHLPDVLNGNYQPTLDMREWLLTANREFGAVFSNINTGASNFSAIGPTIIPATEWWYVWSVSAYFPLAAADTAQGQIAVKSSHNGGTVVQQHAAIEIPLFTAPAGGSQFGVSRELRRLFGPDTSWGVAYTALGLAAPRTCTMHFEFTRLPI